MLSLNTSGILSRVTHFCVTKIVLLKKNSAVYQCNNQLQWGRGIEHLINEQFKALCCYFLFLLNLFILYLAEVFINNNFMKILIIQVSLLIAFVTTAAQPIVVYHNNHFLSTPDGEPFFWLGDTGWELFHRLNRDEATHYIKKRKQQGFNVIQAVALSELDGINSPNAYNDLPLINNNIEEIYITEGDSVAVDEQYDYWDHVKYIVKTAAENDIIIGLLPCWGEYVTPRTQQRLIDTEEKGYNYGLFIGDWLKEYNNHIVWILGGDRLPDEMPEGVAIWRAMAEGITDGVNGDKGLNGFADYSNTFMTYHCYASSYLWFKNDQWIDMHSWGSYHEKQHNERAFYQAWHSWEKSQFKPFINSEPAYENLPVNYDWQNEEYGRFTADDVRQAAYWSVFAGSAGHTYGAHEVWMMYKPQYTSLPLTKNLHTSWQEALDYRGAGQMQYLKKLMLSYDYFSREPNRYILAENTHDPKGRLIATSGDKYAMVYAPTGKIIKVDKSEMDFESIQFNWFNPRTGDKSPAAFTEKNGIMVFDPPGIEKYGNDWVLILSTPL